MGQEWGPTPPLSPKGALVFLVASLILIGLAMSGVLK